MAYINHNVNMYLLFLMLFTATSLVGASVFFQHQVESMATAYNGQIGQVNGLAQELALKQSALADAEKDLQVREARETRLNQLNEKLASSASEREQPAPITGAATAEKNDGQPKVRSLNTVIGSGITARPRRAMNSFVVF